MRGGPQGPAELSSECNEDESTGKEPRRVPSPDVPPRQRLLRLHWSARLFTRAGERSSWRPRRLLYRKNFKERLNTRNETVAVLTLLHELM